MTEIDFYFDFLSPYSYLAYTIARNHFLNDENIKFNLKPVSLPHLISKSGNSPPGNLEVRAEYLIKDLKRSTDFYNLKPFKMPPNFPFDTRPLLNSLLNLQAENKSAKEIDEFVMRTWEKLFHEGNLEDCNSTFKKGGINVNKNKLDLMKNTREALELGAYGVPFWRIKNDSGEVETFFGSDRFNHLAKFIGKDPLPFYQFSKL